MQNPPKILYANINRDTNIRDLQAKWPCTRPGCGASYCFVSDKGEHTQLSHEKLDIWVMAMVRLRLLHISECCLDDVP
jgi:hypothetical protein